MKQLISWSTWQFLISLRYSKQVEPNLCKTMYAYSFINQQQRLIFIFMLTVFYKKILFLKNFETIIFIIEIIKFKVVGT